MVAVALPRGPDQIAAFLAILRAGGAFLPLDPVQPTARLAALVEDAGARLLLARGSTLDGLSRAGPGGLARLDPSSLDLASEPETAPPRIAHPDQLAYVIYTSGSTGRPKGVAVAHGPLARHVRATGAVYGTNRQTRELHVLSMSFDGAQERWMVPLAFGGCVVLKPDGLWTPREALDAMERHGVTHAGFPTAYMHQLALEAASGPRPSRRSYSFGGEALSRESFGLIGRALDPTLLINGYGPTETVISPLVWRARAGDAVEGAYAPIGRAVGIAGPTSSTRRCSRCRWASPGNCISAVTLWRGAISARPGRRRTGSSPTRSRSCRAGKAADSTAPGIWRAGGRTGRWSISAGPMRR